MLSLYVRYDVLFFLCSGRGSTMFMLTTGHRFYAVKGKCYPSCSLQGTIFLLPSVRGVLCLMLTKGHLFSQ